MCYQMLKCLLFRGLHWFYRAFIFCYFSTVFITVNLKAFLPFVFFQLPKLNIKTCRVVPEPLRPAGLTTLLQISADIVVCVLCSVHINHQPIGWVFIESMRGVSTLSICPISPTGKLLQSVWGMLLLSAATLCMLNFVAATNIDGEKRIALHTF